MLLDLATNSTFISNFPGLFPHFLELAIGASMVSDMKKAASVYRELHVSRIRSYLFPSKRCSRRMRSSSSGAIRPRLTDGRR
ncbi:hypothetical protein QQP08_018061 [Theobroma cacao]|nr:hypothetical protein QQP08_018061 [Theobroma cacao]